MNESNLHNYQRFAVEHVISHPAAGLLLDMGLGKTVSTLTAINRLIYEEFEISNVLVIAPKKVAENTWATEAAGWEHLKHLKVSKILGTEKQRKEALRAKADVYVINRENVVWLVSHLGGACPFDMLVIDESSSFKSAKAARFKALRTMRPQFDRVVILTGTPTPNGLIDLWPQMYLLDQGDRLGKTITNYRDRYFSPGKRNGAIIYDYKLRDSSEEAIYRQIGDICVSMKADDYLQLPARIDRTVEINLSPQVQEQYNTFEEEQILQLQEDQEGDISALNAAALSNKLLQFANGAVYDADRNIHHIHDEKLEALAEIIEAANGQPVLLFYSFKHDLYRIQERFKSYKPREMQTPKDLQDWNDGKIQLLVAHPASAGHGLNLQKGGSIVVWYGLNWSLELYQQANARLHRQGQTKPVMVFHLIAKGTLDEDVMKALSGKATRQEALMEAVKARVKKYYL